MSCFVLLSSLAGAKECLETEQKIEKCSALHGVT